MKIYDRIFDNFKSQYMLMIPLTIIFQSCYGSLIMLHVLKKGGDLMILQMAVCILVTMFYNASILAQLNPKLVFKLLLLSLFSNTLILFL